MKGLNWNEGMPVALSELSATSSKNLECCVQAAFRLQGSNEEVLWWEHPVVLLDHASLALQQGKIGIGAQDAALILQQDRIYT